MPKVPVVVRVLTGFERFLEPRVQVGGVVEHEVEDDMDAALMCFSQQGVEILHRAKLGVDGVVIGNVIAEVAVWGGVDGREPDPVDA